MVHFYRYVCSYRLRQKIGSSFWKDHVANNMRYTKNLTE